MGHYALIFSDYLCLRDFRNVRLGASIIYLGIKTYSIPIIVSIAAAALFKRIIRNRTGSVLSGLFLYAIPDNSLFVEQTR